MIYSLTLLLNEIGVWRWSLAVAILLCLYLYLDSLDRCMRIGFYTIYMKSEFWFDLYDSLLAVFLSLSLCLFHSVSVPLFLCLCLFLFLSFSLSLSLSLCLSNFLCLSCSVSVCLFLRLYRSVSVFVSLPLFFCLSCSFSVFVSTAFSFCLSLFVAFSLLRHHDICPHSKIPPQSIEMDLRIWKYFEFYDMVSCYFYFQRTKQRSQNIFDEKPLFLK